MLNKLRELRSNEEENVAAETATSSSTPAAAAGSTNSNTGGSSSSSTGGSNSHSSRSSRSKSRSSNNRSEESAVDPIIAGERIFSVTDQYSNTRSEHLFEVISLLYVNPTLAGSGNPYVQARERVLLSARNEAAAAAAGGGQSGRSGRSGEGRGGDGAAAGDRGQAFGESKREETIWGDDEEEQLDIADTAAGLHPDAEGADYLYFDDLVDGTGERLWPGERSWLLVL
jgi:hypothetical protein